MSARRGIDTARTAALTAAVLLPGACGRDPPSAGTTVRDSAGVALVDNVGPAGSPWRLADSPALDVGAVDGPPPLQLSNVTGTVVSSAGELVVADGTSGELRFFGPDGEHRRSVGGPGEGPGEFAALAGLQRRGDRLLAFDSRLARISTFDATGTLLETTPGGDPYVGRLSDGTAISFEFERGGQLVPGTVHRGTGWLRLQGPDDPRRFATIPLAEAWVDRRIPGRSTRIFGSETAWLVGAEHVVVVDNGAPDIRVYDASGSLVQRIRTGPARGVDEADRASFRAAYAERFADDPRLQMFLDPIDAQPLPPRMPRFGRSAALTTERLPWLFGDENGGFWILEYRATPADPAVWQVFDSTGRRVARIAMPEGFVPMWAGEDRVAGAWRDALDVEHARVYDIVRRAEVG